MTTEGLMLALLIFFLRVLNFAIGTIRTITTARGQRLISAILAAFGALIFAVVIGKVVTDLDNIPNLIAYCTGASVGSYVGMILETKFIRSFMIVNAITAENGRDAAAVLRAEGFGVTTTVGEGKDGKVTNLRSVVDKRDVPQYLGILQEICPDAFIAIEEARGVKHGWVTHSHRRIG